MPTIRLLALDIDGTVVNSRHELTPATRSALGRAREAGLRIVLATGRRYSRTLPLVEPLGLEVPLITASGALIKDPGEHRTLFRAEFADGSLVKLLETVSSAGFEPIVYGDTFSLGYDYYCRTLESSSVLLNEFFAKNPGCERLHRDLVTRPPQEVFAAFAMGSRPEMHALARHLDHQLPGQLSVHVLRSPRYAGYMCEIAPFGVCKWSGVQRIAQTMNISAEEICAVGDDVNDIPMIRAAGVGVAMGNALDEVKSVADYVAPSHDEDGLVWLVDWLLDEPV